MFQRNYNTSVAQFGQHSPASEQVNDADFQSAASSPSHFSLSQPSTSTFNSGMVKIIDIQKTRQSKRNDRHQQQQQASHQMTTSEEESSDSHNRNAATPTGTVSGFSGGPGRSSSMVAHPSDSSTNLQQPLLESAAGNSNSSRWSPNVTPKGATNQKQPSGENLSSFESDYDLLVYLGETETEDLVDTERSLDYQDQTWRESICGASLAPTIDESLSELIGGGHYPGQAQDFDLLNTPTPLGIATGSPFVASSPARSLSSQRLDAPFTPAGLNQRQTPLTASNNSKTAPRQHKPAQTEPRQLWQPSTTGNYRPDEEDDDDCDSEVLSAFRRENKLQPDNYPGSGSLKQDNAPQTSGYNHQGKHQNNDYANLPVKRQNHLQQGTSNNNKIGNKFVSLFNTTKSCPSKEVKDENSSWRRNVDHIKSSTMGRNQEMQITGGDELDRLLAEMSQSLDLESLARYDTQPLASVRSNPLRTNNRNTEQASSETTMGRLYGQPDATTGYRKPGGQNTEGASQIIDDPSEEAQTRSKSSMSQKMERPVERIVRLEARQQASNESILDEYDGASRMLEQMISDQLAESAASTRKRGGGAQQKPQQWPSKQTHRPHNQRADSLSQSIHSADTGSRDSPKSVIAAYNYPSCSASRYPVPQRPTMGSSRGSRTSVAAAPNEQASSSSRKVSTCSSSPATEASVVVLPTASKMSSTTNINKQYGSQEPIILGSREPLEKRSIWRPGGRLVMNRRRETSCESNENNNNRKSTESASQMVARLNAEKQAKSPPPPPKVDYDGCGDGNEAEAGFIRVEAADMPAEVTSSDDDDGIKVQESQMNRMKRRTLSNFRSVRNRISDFMARDQALKRQTAANGAQERERTQTPAPPKRSSSIGSRSELQVSKQIASSPGERPSPDQQGARESRSMKRHEPARKGEAATAKGGPSFGQQIRERLSRSKSRLSKFLRPDKTRRAQSQPGGGPHELPETSAKEELLFQPGDLARNWTSVEREPLRSRLVPEKDKFDDAKAGITSPVPPPTTSSNSSLSGLDTTTTTTTTTTTRIGRPARRKQPPNKANNASSRPASLISRLSASLKTSKESKPRGDEDDPMEIQGSNGNSGAGKLSKRARRRTRKAAASVNQLAACSRAAQDSSAGHKAQMATTNDYFGQVAPPRVESPANASTTSGGSLQQGEKGKSGATSPIYYHLSEEHRPDRGSQEPRRPNRSQSLRSVSLMVPRQKSTEVDDGSDGQHQHRRKEPTAAHKRTVSFSNLSATNRRALPPTLNTFRPASAGAKLEASGADATDYHETSGPIEAVASEVFLLVTPVGPRDASCSNSGIEQAKFKPLPPPFGQHLLHSTSPKTMPPPATRSKSAAMLDDIRHKCSSLFGGGASPNMQIRRNTPATSSPVPRRPPRARGGARVRSKSAMARDYPPEMGQEESDGQVIGVQVVTPPPGSSLERDGCASAGSAPPPSRGKLASFAQHLKHSASDFFNQAGETKRPQMSPPRPPLNATGTSTSKSPTGDRGGDDKLTYCEWKPVIAVRDAKLANRSAGRSIVTGMLMMGKDGFADDGYDDDGNEEEAPKGSIDRTGPSAIARFKRTRLRMQQRQQQQQSSLDTDSTWEESSEDEARLGKAAKANDKTIERPTLNDTSRVVQSGSENESSAAAAILSLPADDLTIISTSGRADNVGKEGSGLRAVGDMSNIGERAAVAIDDKATQARRRATTKGFSKACEQLDNNNINNSSNASNFNNNNHSEPKQAKRESEGGEEAQQQQLLILQQQQQQQPQQQQVASQSDGNSKNFYPTEQQTEEKGEGKSEQQADVEWSGNRRSGSDHQSLTSEQQRICKIPFRFNADLPLPSRSIVVNREKNPGRINSIISDDHQARKQGQKPEALGDSKEPSKKSKIPTRTTQKIISQELDTQKEHPMVATMTRPAASSTINDETDARLLGVLARKRGAPLSRGLVGKDSAGGENDENLEDDDESQKRLSVYENMPNGEQVATEHQQQQKQKRGWRKPPWPPEKPAHLRKVAEPTPPESPSAWSVGDPEASASCLPKLPAEKLQELNRALREATEDKQPQWAPSECDTDRQQEPPAKPKRRLVTMTSIIQDPNDELMVAGAATAASSKADIGPPPPGSQRHKSFIRQDSSLSITNTDGNQSEDSDSSFAAAAANRRRLVNRFESKPITAPKCPAFEDGKSALTRAAPSGGSGGGGGCGGGQESLVKRLAKTFDQTAQDHQHPPKSAKPPVRGGPNTQFGARRSVDLDEPKSESTTWYDAKSSEQLDEAEVAKFLAEFDNERQSTVSEEVSTGADQFVTVAESTLEEPLGHGDLDEPDEDDTLNDEVDVDDDLNEDETFDGDVAPKTTAEQPVDSSAPLQRQHQQQQGKDKTSSPAAELVPIFEGSPGAESEQCGQLCEGLRASGREHRVAKASGKLDETNDNDDLSEINNSNRNNNKSRSSDRASGYDSGSSVHSDTTITTTTVIDIAHDDDDDASRAVYAQATAASTPPIPSNCNFNNTPAATVPGSTPNSPTNAHHAVDAATTSATTTTISNPAVAHEIKLPSETSGAHLIDNKFKNSLNHIIARRSSRMGPIDVAEAGNVEAAGQTSCDNNSTTNALKKDNITKDQKADKKQNKSKAPKKATKKGHLECPLVSSKELKGLTRYYHALLGRRSHHRKSAPVTKIENLPEVTTDEPVTTTNEQKPTTQIDDCIHSSSPSTSASCSSCPSASCSRSSSPVSSRSPSLVSSCSSTANSDDEEEDANGNRSNVLRQMDDQKLIRNTKMCSRLYDELEKILAHRVAKQQRLPRRPQSGSWGTSEPEEPPPTAGDLPVEDEFEEQHQQEANDFGAFYTWSLASTEPDDQISLSSSSLSSESIPEIKQRQNLQKLYHIVNEIHSSEAKFVDTLRLLNVDFRQHMQQSAASSGGGGANECISSILKHLPQLQALNENLLDELKQARDQWPKTRKIAHVLVKIGPFLKHYSTYIREFDGLQQQFVESMKKHSQFAERVREFEASERCQKLTIQHHLLRPIQRIPQYRLLLQQYLHHLKPDDVDYEDTVNALEVVSRVAEHANQSMNEGANFAKLLALQAKIVGKQRDIVQPGRLFVKEGELLKVCRKQVQPRWFVLLNDALLYLTQIQSSDILYLNNELPLDDCLVSTPSESKQSHNLIGQQFETEFSVCTKTRSFALIAKSRAERDDWVATFRRTIDEHLARRRSFSIRHNQMKAQSIETGEQQQQQESKSGQLGQKLYQTLPLTSQQARQGHLLGQKAPLWTPDSRVSMCQLCTSSFSALFRRHHCRSCGRVVCSACSSNRAPLVYLKCRSARVCDQCFEQLKSNIHLYYLGGQQPASNEQELRRLDEHFRTLLKSQFVRHAGLKGLRLASSNSGASLQLLDSKRQNGGRGPGGRLFNERLGTNDSGSTISGYLHHRHQTKPKWKRQWFVIRDKVLYAYRATDDVAAISSTPLLGFNVDQPSDRVDGLEPKTLIRLRHLSDYARCSPPSPPQLLSAQVLASPRNEPLKRKVSKGKGDELPVIEHLFKAESVGAAERWLEAFQMSVVLNDSETT